MRLTPDVLDTPLRDVDVVLRQCRAKADFYAAIHPPAASDDVRLVQRQAFAGWLWTKQIYLFDVSQWLEGGAVHRPLPKSRRFVRTNQWRHLNSMRILSTPDKWELPWFAAWDLAFHVLPLAMVDPDYAKEQLWGHGPLLAKSHPLSRVLPRRARTGIGRLAPDRVDRARGLPHRRMAPARRRLSNQFMYIIPMLYSGRLPRRPSILTSIPARVAMTPCTRPTR